jgi:hypothetical protein
MVFFARHEFPTGIWSVVDKILKQLSEPAESDD